MLACDACGGELTGRQRKFCSKACSKRAQRKAWLWNTYALTVDEYNLILTHQGNVCGCCGKPFKEGQTPHVDHEHGGPVRGIVHPYCNTRLIGRLKDADLAQRLANYLLNPPAVEALGGSARVAPGRPRKRRKRKGAK